MVETTLKEQVANALVLTEDELFASLVSDKERVNLYSSEGIIAKGKQIFSVILPKIREPVCTFYSSHTKTVGHSIEFASLLAVSLQATPAVVGLPVIPLTALLIKIGLDEICASQP